MNWVHIEVEMVNVCVIRVMINAESVGHFFCGIAQLI